MSTAQDHKALASLQDVFGPGAGSSGYNFNSGVATFSSTGAAGSSGREGSAGSPGLQAVNVAGQLFNANNLKNSLNDINRALANAETLEEIDAAIAKAEKVSKTDQRIGTLGDIATGVGYAGTAGKVLGGELGTGGSAALTGLKTAVPGVGMASGLGSLFGKYDPINPALNKGAELVNKVPGMEYVNQGLESLGAGIRKIPGTGTASIIAEQASGFPDQIIKAPLTIYESLKNSKADEASARDKALTQLFTQEGSDGRLYISPPTSNEEVVGVDLPGNVNTVGVGSYSGRYNFPADEGKTRQQLYEEFQNSETYKGLISEKRGLQTLATQAKEDAAEAKEREVAISELTDPVQNIVPVSAHAEWGTGTHYADEYGTWDVDTGEKLNVPDFYEPALPVLEPIPFEAPTAPEFEYQAPKAPAPVEMAPTVRSDELNPLKRVRPEEVVTPRIMTPRRIRPQRETAPSLSRHEQDLANYKIAVEKESARKAGLYGDHFTSRPTTNYSKAQAADLLGFNAPLRTASQYMDLDARTKPKHNLRELTTGRNASSYRG
jgi:hypothetical protein